MRLTVELKKKIDNAASEEEAKAILDDVKNRAKDAGIILDEEELDQAAGGGSSANGGHSNTVNLLEEHLNGVTVF